MTDFVRVRPAGVRAVGWARTAVGVAVIAVLVYAYALRIVVDDGNPFDYFGYFTNQTALLASAVLIATGVLHVSGRQVPGWLTTARAVATALLIVVAVVYNLLVPGTGSAPPWVSAVLHAAFPIAVLLDWLLIGDRRPLPWRRLWLVLPYPILWLVVVLARGVTDGWVPYGFLLPGQGVPSLVAHIAGLLAALVAAGALVWWAARLPALFAMQSARPALPARLAKTRA